MVPGSRPATQPAGVQRSPESIRRLSCCGSPNSSPGPRRGCGTSTGVAEAIPLPEGSAAVAWSIATVHHWSDIDAGLREVRRVLLPVAVWSPWSGERNEVPAVTQAMAGPTSKRPRSPTDAANTASATFAWSERRSDADRRSAWSPTPPDRDGDRSQSRRGLRARTQETWTSSRATIRHGERSTSWRIE